MFGVCAAYYAQFKEAPRDHFQDELETVLAPLADEEQEATVQYVDRLIELTSPHKPYVLTRLNDFVRERELQTALIAASEQVAVGGFVEAENTIYAALKAGIHQFEVGLEYLTDHSGIHTREEKPSYLMSTGIAGLDYLIGGYQRGELLCFLGGYKGMKSWCLQHLALAGVTQGLNVLHVSHEMTRQQTELRYDMMLTSRGTMRIGETETYPVIDPVTHKLKKVETTIRSIYEDPAVVVAARKKVARRGGKLIVKKYPQDTCTCAELERYMNYLERFEGFVPDVVITDYADIMAPDNPKDEIRHQLDKTYKRMKAIADERGVLVATASQVTTDSLMKRNLTQKSAAEDRRKVAHVDWMIGIGRDDIDVKANVGRLSIVAGRSGGQGSHCTFSTCPFIGQFCISSWTSSDYDNAIYAMYAKD